jgi:hypothetical protein
MPLQIDFYGVYVPGFFGLMLAAYLATLILRRVAGWVGLYSLVWHRALFDLALFLLVLSALFFLNLRLMP